MSSHSSAMVAEIFGIQGLMRAYVGQAPGSRCCLLFIHPSTLTITRITFGPSEGSSSRTGCSLCSLFLPHKGTGIRLFLTITQRLPLELSTQIPYTSTPSEVLSPFLGCVYKTGSTLCSESTGRCHTTFPGLDERRNVQVFLSLRSADLVLTKSSPSPFSFLSLEFFPVRKGRPCLPRQLPSDFFLQDFGKQNQDHEAHKLCSFPQNDEYR